MYKLQIVDDEAVIREGIERLVDWDGLGLVLSASCGTAMSALACMLDDTPDILLADIRMPGMDGLELAKRAALLHPQLKTIILSGHDAFAYAQKAIQAGVIEYLLKPCSQETLNTALSLACRAVEKERRKLLYALDERQTRIRVLAESLDALCSTDISGCRLSKRVSEMIAATDDPSLLREALAGLVSGTPWGADALMEAFRDESALERVIGMCLLRLKAEGVGLPGFVRKMMQYATDHYSQENLSLQYLADHVTHMSVDYIGREFIKATGRKFSDYLLDIRMEHAKVLMAANKSMHIYEIAEQVGMGDNPHYFSMVFKKHSKQTPKEYKDSLQA